MRSIEKGWYEGAWWSYLLLPASWLFVLISTIRRGILRSRAEKVRLEAPVVVIGNLSVGGTGKTPVILALIDALREAGVRPGVVSRGYRAEKGEYPIQVGERHTALQVGDEPLLIYRQSRCPVVVDPDRCRACHYLLGHNDVDVILSDDGLQHYAMPRDIEVVVVDGERLFGNGMRLPAGPLREPVSRLHSVDAILVNNGARQHQTSDRVLALASATPVFNAHLQVRTLCNLKTGEQRPFTGAPFKMGDRVQAVAGIGNPARFFQLVDQLPYEVEHFAFPDHHAYRESDFPARGIDLSRPIVMTEKDGIKCQSFANENFWVLHINLQLPDEFKALIKGLIAKCQAQSSELKH